ncbi:MAG: 30S ribosomal protein S3 [Candidatus Aenigmarchaeota archaeon]|nr:30S ribosomal protein S3 [Candidatus Aenigmarchaeota archaeon]
MSIEKTFVKEGIKVAEVEEFLRKKFEKAGYSHTEIQRTPLGTRIIVHVHKPGLVIGRSGRRVNEITEDIRKKFGFENPLLDVREVSTPLLIANIVASRIVTSIEKGINYKKAVNYYMDKVIEAGAVGISVEVAGKIGGVERSRGQKFKKGFVAHSGEIAERLVDYGYTQANIQAGVIGIKVRIMQSLPKEVAVEKKLHPS